jgi:hypothetical protein
MIIWGDAMEIISRMSFIKSKGVVTGASVYIPKKIINSKYFNFNENENGVMIDISTKGITIMPIGIKNDEIKRYKYICERLSRNVKRLSEKKNKEKGCLD